MLKEKLKSKIFFEHFMNINWSYCTN